MNVKGEFSDKSDTSVGQLVQRYYFWNIKACLQVLYIKISIATGMQLSSPFYLFP